MSPRTYNMGRQIPKKRQNFRPAIRQPVCGPPVSSLFFSPHTPCAQHVGATLVPNNYISKVNL